MQVVARNCRIHCAGIVFLICGATKGLKQGRLREHYQLNVDIFGVPGIEADHEIIQIADSILQAFRAKRDMYEIHVNSRTLVNWLLLEHLRLDRTQATAVMRVIDRMNKISGKEFASLIDALLNQSQRDNDVTHRLMDILKAKKLSDLPLTTQQHPAVAELEKLLGMLEQSGVKNAVFDISIMRGFDYYTNIVFEVFDTHPDNNRSMFGGGRYDGLVELFGVNPLPVVGFGMGDVTLQNFLNMHKLLPSIHPETDAVVILIGDLYTQVQPMLKTMRAEGVRLAVDATDRKMDAKIKSAVKAEIPYALFIGEEELKSGRLKLKNLVNNEQKEHSIERVISILDARHRPLENT